LGFSDATSGTDLFEGQDLVGMRHDFDADHACPEAWKNSLGLQREKGRVGTTDRLFSQQDGTAI
jgi:hypothetical protein